MANSEQTQGHAFYPTPFRFKSNTSGKSKAISFSTSFVFAIPTDYPHLGGHGISFFISPTTNLSSAYGSQYLGLFNANSHGKPTNHIFAVELDTIQNPEFQDIDDNHVGIDINGLRSIKSCHAGYYVNGTSLFNLSLISGQLMQVWVDYDGEAMQLNVTLSPITVPKPVRPLLSSIIDLSSLMFDSMYVGLSASTGSFHNSHNILARSFQMTGLPETPSYPKPQYHPHRNFIWFPVALFSLVLFVVAVSVLIIVRRRIKYAEILEDWEIDYGPHRFLYKDLFEATKGLVEKEFLGNGGFGRVYEGVLPISKMEVAVKKVSHESKQRIKEFVAEIVTIGRLRHKNLVQLLGYCRHKGELLLVYDFMPNGSLDRFLFDRTKPTLDWTQRFRIIKGVASSLVYLHEYWERDVIHRDIKASNVLLDHDLNGKLGDFGLARLYAHGTDPQTTRVAGTVGYLAPELTRTGKATTATVVFAFGAFLLEVACGRRPVEPHEQGEKLLLMDWVLTSWQKGSILETRDSRLGDKYCTHEVELVLKLGLLCSNPMPAARPSMQQNLGTLFLFNNEGSDDQIEPLCSTIVTISGISGGR